MLKKSDVLNIISVGLKLFLITAISAFTLAFMNSITEPIIKKNNEIKKSESMQTVLSAAKLFESEPIDKLATVDLAANVSEIYAALNENNEKIGYAVMVSANGYGGEISMVVGIDHEQKVSGIEFISHSETPGLGAKCTDEKFKVQYIGKSDGIKVSKKGAKGNEIDAISSATITSNAVTNCVNVAITAVSIIEGVE